MVTIILPPELEKVVTEQAQQGTTPELVVMDGLQKLYLPLRPPITEQDETLADYRADYIGSVDSSEIVPGGANLCEDTGRKFEELMLQKCRDGKL